MNVIPCIVLGSTLLLWLAGMPFAYRTAWVKREKAHRRDGISYSDWQEEHDCPGMRCTFWGVVVMVWFCQNFYRLLWKVMGGWLQPQLPIPDQAEIIRLEQGGEPGESFVEEYSQPGMVSTRCSHVPRHRMVLTAADGYEQILCGACGTAYYGYGR